jgi:RNA polymerase sigma-B factor
MNDNNIENIPDADITDHDDIYIKYRQNPNVTNRNEIVKKNLYLAEIISRKFLNRGIDYEDLYQVASIALIKAAERFDPDKGVKFVTFATPTIIGEIKRFFRDKGAVIRIPRRIYEIYQKVNNAKDTLTQELGRVPRIDEIAAYLNISDETVIEITESWNAFNIQSFDANPYSDEDLELHETIGSEDSMFEKIENRDFVEKSLEKFNEIERVFIKLRYFENKTQKYIADDLGVSQMYISRMEKKVLDKFRMILSK